MVCLRNISVDTLHKGETEDDYDDNIDDDNNKISIIGHPIILHFLLTVMEASRCVWELWDETRMRALSQGV
jgi:hypothetical protein